MINIIKLSEIPQNSLINDSFGKADYIDCYEVAISTYQDYSIDYLTALFFTSFPTWIKKLFSIRNYIVKFSGLKGYDKNKLKEPDKSVFYPIGSEAVIFKVLSRNKNEIVMAENDKHLNFRTSLLFEKVKWKEFGYLFCSTLVKYNKIFGKSKSKNPEDDYLVTITEELVKVEHPQRKTEQIFWKNITEIRLINTDDGPSLPDVWLALIGDNSGCLIPQGAKGYDTVYNIVSKYDGFNFENVIKSMACVSNEQFLLWSKK